MSTPELMKAAAEMAAECVSLMRDTGAACFESRPATDLSLLGGAMLARSAQSAASATLLASRGLVGDAMSCGRTLTELAIDFAYIAKQPERTKRFMAYTGIHHQKLATNVASHGGSVPADVIANLDAFRADFKTNNPGKLGSWSGNDLFARATEASKLAMYELSYCDQCAASHSGPITLEYATMTENGERFVHFGEIEPETHPIMLVITAACVLVGDVVDHCGLDRALGYRSVALAERTGTIVDRDRLRR